MTRSRRTAKQAGTAFEQLVADGLANELGNPDIDRAPRKGSKDIGDIANVRHANGARIAIEAKDFGGKLIPTQWVREAAAEAANYKAICGVVIAKRRGTRRFEDQWVLLTGADLIALLTGEQSTAVSTIVESATAELTDRPVS
ncbi:restriction endonuclease [Arthrobacter sp. ISL-69]|uniref:restriction endonuclease n=1 Tax=Arthrobacter sp. ISL-69 TaxID=2819113 RepID=UPI001BE5A511|nr:restriction endonuclease [Arthrobacter sp. ISL-69]MBT2537236.1 restriction endonuclease [Arthrobacter sp. ISL-69]